VRGASKPPRKPSKTTKLHTGFPNRPQNNEVAHQVPKSPPKTTKLLTRFPNRLKKTKFPSPSPKKYNRNAGLSRSGVRPVRVGPVGVVEVRKKLIMHNAITAARSIFACQARCCQGWIKAHGRACALCSTAGGRAALEPWHQRSAPAPSPCSPVRSPKTRPALLQAQRHIAYT
jgi:hypothetical protein